MPIYPNNIPTILIVDDEPFNLEFLEIVLKQQGYNILTASDGRSGREMAEQMQPDLILLDIMMPGENGFECATVLRLSPETSEIPIIFLSALDDEDNTSRGYDAGAVDFIVKPFEYKNVVNLIRLHLKLHFCDSQRTVGTPHHSGSIKSIDYPSCGARTFFTAPMQTARTFVYETVVTENKTESHFLLNCAGVNEEEIHEKIRFLLAENTGPLFSPSETMRNIGMDLNKHYKKETQLTASYVRIDRETETLTVVNAGALPVILIKEETLLLIERQSESLGCLGLGHPPCSTFKTSKGDRIFMLSRGLLSSFDWEGDGIRELQDDFLRHTGNDIESVCRNAGKALLKKGALEGILSGIEL
jgi:sigma-B regulation protein RsbU (phosphoserine phosphatase)